MFNLQELDRLRMPLDHIKSATNDFSKDNILGQGGFGTVYEGQLYTDRDPGITVAVKRLDVKGQQGTKEFLTEIIMLASCKHKNLVSFIGFVNEGSETIIVYKKEDNGSLDKYLGSTNLTWEQRLRICLGAARGLEYLHSGVGTEHRVLHRDLKSSNILLDANWEAKISDFGLSKIGPRNTLHTFVVTEACGTPGYVDPQYAKTLVLKKESDVYSFGVVLFEVLCGRFATIVKSNGEYDFLSTLVNKYYGEGKLDEIIFPSLVEQAKPDSLELFSRIAFRCLIEDQRLRPTITSVVEELESALEHQLGGRTTVPEPQTGTQTKLWGSKTGGRPFMFQLKSNEKLRKITIYHNIWIHRLRFTAQDSSNGLLREERYGIVPPYDQFFKGRHAPKFEIDLDADEEIIGLSGSIGVYNGYELVASLCFTTNKRKYGPFSHEGDNRFSGSWDVGRFDGFYGRSGYFIDAVGCCLKPAAN